MGSANADDSTLGPKRRNLADRLAATGPRMQLDPATTGALTKLAVASPAIEAYQEKVARQLAPTLTTLNQFNNYKINVLRPELAHTAASLSNLNFPTTQYATSPGFKALMDSTRALPPFESILSDQMKATFEAAKIAPAGPAPAATAITTAAASLITETFTAANSAALLTASQAIGGLNEPLRLKHSLMASELAQTIYASSQAIRRVDALTLSKIGLAAEYAARVSSVLDEDEGLAEVAGAIERRFVDRFKMSREAAHNAVHVLVWMTIFSAIVCGIVRGPAAAAEVIGAVMSATGRLNADSLAKAAAKKIVPLDRQQRDVG